MCVIVCLLLCKVGMCVIVCLLLILNSLVFQEVTALLPSKLRLLELSMRAKAFLLSPPLAYSATHQPGYVPRDQIQDFRG